MIGRLILAILAVAWLGAPVAAAATPSGQRAIGRSTVEPAFDDATGRLIYLLTPDKVQVPSMANPHAVAPMFLPVYPDFSSVDASSLNCTPTTCDHVNVLPFVPEGYTNGGTACESYGMPAGSCALIKGHDHLVGVPHTGDFNVAWHVEMLIFTPKGIADGAVNFRVTTLDQASTLVTNGDAFFADTPITFNCSMVSAAVYNKGVPLSF